MGTLPVQPNRSIGFGPFSLSRDGGRLAVGAFGASLVAIYNLPEKTVLGLARKAVAADPESSDLPWRQMALGMAEFRSGNYLAADKALASAINGAALFNDYRRELITGTAQFHLAMTRYRQGRDAESRRILREATASMKPLPANPGPPGRHQVCRRPGALSGLQGSACAVGGTRGFQLIDSLRQPAAVGRIRTHLDARATGPRPGFRCPCGWATHPIDAPSAINMQKKITDMSVSTEEWRMGG